MPFLALEGIRVIETATGIAGPYCGKLLADYGAEVIKVEQPSVGDPSRSQGTLSPTACPTARRAPSSLHLNTNKKSVTPGPGEPRRSRPLQGAADTVPHPHRERPPRRHGLPGLGLR